MLAVADPSNSAAIKAATIVLGEDLLIQIASFEDIATALDQRLGQDEAGPDAISETATAQQDDSKRAANHAIPGVSGQW
jgi:general secretion pathway protein E